MKIAFIVGIFPAVSETFIINQIADLKDRGINIEIFSFNRGDTENISERYWKYNMASFTHYVDMPKNKLIRLLRTLPKILKLLFVAPDVLLRALDIKKYGRDALSLKLLFWSEPFVGKKFDLYHCYFGKIANQFLIIKDILNIEAKIITSFLGYDVSKIFHDHPGKDIYKRLKKESSAFIVMSNNMKERIIAQGFNSEKIYILPISVDINSYPFKERTIKEDEMFKMCSVGRFVEKKGFDDLLRAVAIVKERSKRPFRCNLIGGGVLEDKLRDLAKKLNIEDVVEFKGYMKIEDIIKYFLDMHLYVQPSKTARDGDME